MTGPSNTGYVYPEEYFRLGDPEVLHQREGLEPDVREEPGVRLSSFPGCSQPEPPTYLHLANAHCVGFDGSQATTCHKTRHLLSQTSWLQGVGKSRMFCQLEAPTGTWNLEQVTEKQGQLRIHFCSGGKQSQQWPLVSGGGNVSLDARVRGGLTAVGGGARGFLSRMSRALTLTVVLAAQLPLMPTCLRKLVWQPLY